MDTAFDRFVISTLKNVDANDMLYAYDASGDYNPRADLEKIHAPLLAINFADDSVNPPELGLFEREMPRVKHGRFIVVPVGRRSIGHVSAGRADVWENYLKEFLASITDHTGHTRSSLD